MENFQIKQKQQIPNRVLVADDDPIMRLLVTTILKQRDCEVVSANDGREAYRILQSDSNFRAAIVDMTMPFLEGLDLIRYMRSERRLMRIPVMMISAEQDIKLMASSFAAGATAFLPKPFTPEQLQSAIRMLLGQGSFNRRAA
jgi:two-component system, chemotaxis family, chemotaxis protein CheY